MSRKEEEFLRRQQALGYVPSLDGMDEEDLDYVPSWSSRHPSNQQPEPVYREFRPVDRDFAERIFKMFARRFDPSWQMPNLDGTEYSQSQQSGSRYNGSQVIKSAPGIASDDLGMKVRDGGIGDSQLAYRPSLSPTSVSSYSYARGSSGNEGAEVKTAGFVGRALPYVKEGVEAFFTAREFAEEVEKEARANGDSPELAKKKAEDARGMFHTWQAAVAAGTTVAGGEAGTIGADAVGTGGAIATPM